MEDRINILYSDASVAVAVKPAGLLSESGDIRSSFAARLEDELGGAVFPVHRLDRVTPGVSSTIARRSPMSLLKSVLLPTLGLPTIAIIGLDIIPPYFIFPGRIRLTLRSRAVSRRARSLRACIRAR